MRKHNEQKEFSHPRVIRFATNFLGGLRRMFVSEEWLASSYAKTTAGIAAVDHVFDEPSFWTPIADIVTVIFLFVLISTLFCL